ncbi:MAG TPA: ParB/RepB/Spo0J family partition protein [Oscillatoriaceae cyanobacterium]
MTSGTKTRGSFAAMYEASRQISHDASPRQVRLEQLEPNPEQPRTQFHRETLEELAASIKAYGVLQPLLVRPHPAGTANKYQIIAGERRFQACRIAGVEAVPVVIKQMEDAMVREVALIENLQRENISPLEEAQVLKQILDETGLSHRELGDRIGKTKAYIEQRVRLLRYPTDIKAALATGPIDEARFSPGHAKAAVQLEDVGQRRALITLVETHGLSVREAERRVHQLLKVAEAPERAEKLAAAILKPQGLSDTALDQAIAPKAGRVAEEGPATVDLRRLAVHSLLKAAAESGNWEISSAELRKHLKADLALIS